MKRVGKLWPELVSFPNLLAAATAAARGKRGAPTVHKTVDVAGLAAHST